MIATELAEKALTFLKWQIGEALEVEAEVEFFPKPTKEDPNAIESGEAQAMVLIEGRRFCISVERID